MKIKNRQLFLQVPLLLLAVVVLFSFGFNTAAAANTSTIYVNTIGNNSWDGQSATWNGINGPKQTISNATGTVITNGTIYIAQGTYYESGININTNMTIIGESQQNTIINGTNSGNSIFTIASGVNATIINLTLTQGQSNNGGAIYNNGTLTVTNCTLTDTANSSVAGGLGGAIFNQGGTLIVTNSTLNNNTARIGGAICNRYGNVILTSNLFNNNIAQLGGGAICNYEGNLTMVNSTLNNNIANWTGGAIMNFGTLTVTNSTLNNNTAQTDCGGAICNYDANLTVTNSSFNSNKAPVGGAIYNGADDSSGDVSSVVNFNWIIGNSPNNSEIYSTNGTINATLNWWGSNVDPSSNVQGNVTVTPWLVLNVTANPNSISNCGNSTVTANLLYDNQGHYHNPVNDHVPDRIPVIFTTTLGSMCSLSSTVNGTAQSTLNGGLIAGVANISIKIDNQTVNNSIKVIDTIPPTINVTDPVNGATGVGLNKSVTVMFSEPVKMGNGAIALQSSNGTLIPVTTSVNGSVLTITPKSALSKGVRYTVLVHTGSVTDLAGNNVAGYVSRFTTTSDTTAPTVSSVDPVNGATGVGLNKSVTVMFSEPVKMGNGWIELQSSNGTLIPVTTSVNGSVLTITPKSALSKGVRYTVLVHTGSVTDLAGNNVAGYVSRFTTTNDTVPPTVKSVDPVNGATGVGLNKGVIVTFSEPVKMGNGAIALQSSNGTLVPVTTSVSGSVLTITPKSALVKGVRYTVLVHTGSVTDLAGNNVAGYVSRFTTISDTVPPTVSSVDPVNGAIGVGLNKGVIVTFSEPVKMGNGAIALQSSNGTLVPVTTSVSGSVLTITPKSALVKGVRYTVLVHTGSVTDLAGNNVAGYVSRFTTSTA